MEYCVGAHEVVNCKELASYLSGNFNIPCYLLNIAGFCTILYDEHVSITELRYEKQLHAC